MAVQPYATARRGGTGGNPPGGAAPVTAALLAAFADLLDARIRSALALIALWTVGVLAAVATALFAAVGTVDPGAWIGGGGWLVDWILGGLVAIAAIALSWFAFVVVAQNVAGFFVERVIARVEALHHPDLPPAPGPGVGNAILAGLRFVLLLVAVNAAAAPFYLAGLLFPPASLVLFYAVNGWLAGREYAEIVALRRLTPSGAARWRKSRRLQVFAAGVVIAVVMTVPVLNLVYPVVAAAFMTHLFHRLPAARTGPRIP